MTEILKVSESLKSMIYGPTCSVQSAEDRAIAIEEGLAELFSVGEKFEEIEASLEDTLTGLEEREDELKECRQLLATLVEAVQGFQTNTNSEDTRKALSEAISAAKHEAAKF